MSGAERAPVAAVGHVGGDVPGPGRGPREERYRLAAVAAGVPVALLAAPLVAPIHGRSIMDEVSREPILSLIVLGLVLWSLSTGGISFIYGLRRRVPGAAVFAMPAVVFALASGAIAFILLVAIARQREAREAPAAAMAAIACTLAVYLLLRGFVRGGWERWAQLVAGVWLGQGAIAMLLLFGDAPPLGPQELVPWLLLFVMSALAPVVLWALWPRRGEARLSRTAR